MPGRDAAAFRTGRSTRLDSSQVKSTRFGRRSLLTGVGGRVFRSSSRKREREEVSLFWLRVFRVGETTRENLVGEKLLEHIHTHTHTYIFKI